MTEKPKIDCDPWAVPTEEQKRMFDALSYEDQLKMVRDALDEGDRGKSVDGETFMKGFIAS